MVRRIIFLDIDGVFNTVDRNEFNTTFPAPGMISPFIVDKNRVETFNYVMSQIAPVKVVLSSTWRHDHPDLNYTVASIRDFIKRTGFNSRIFHPDWRTPLIGTGGNRREEIDLWLTDHPEVFKYVVIDDNYAKQFKDLTNGKYIQTQPSVGMTIKNLEKTLNAFGLRLRSDLTVTTAGGPNILLPHQPTIIP